MFDPKTQGTSGKLFTESDVKENRISCLKDELIYNPPAWMRRGLQETASGYGRRLNSGYVIRFNRRMYRLYVTLYGNNGTVWFKVGDRKIIVSAF